MSRFIAVIVSILWGMLSPGFDSAEFLQVMYLVEFLWNNAVALFQWLFMGRRYEYVPMRRVKPKGIVKSVPGKLFMD